MFNVRQCSRHRRFAIHGDIAGQQSVKLLMRDRENQERLHDRKTEASVSGAPTANRWGRVVGPSTDPQPCCSVARPRAAGASRHAAWACANQPPVAAHTGFPAVVAGRKHATTWR
jgi:hypothetical protein